MLDGESEDEASEHKGNDVVHVGLGDLVGGCDAEEGKEEERRHGSDGHGDGLGEPPGEDPGKHSQHVPGGDAVELHKQAYCGAQEGPQEDEETLERENGVDRRVEALRPVNREKRGSGFI